MRPEEHIRVFVLDAIADDYEDFDMIVGDIGRRAAREGVPVTPVEIWEGLMKLIDEGLARAYRLSTTAPPEVIRGRPDPTIDAGCYFYLTPQGKLAIKYD